MATYTIDGIIGEKRIEGIKYYCILWTDYPLSKATWEPAKAIEEQAPKAVKEYQKEYGIPAVKPETNSPASRTRSRTTTDQNPFL